MQRAPASVALPFWIASVLGVGCSSPQAGPSDGKPDGGGVPAAFPIGFGDGTPASVTFTEVYDPRTARVATDVAFDPLRPEQLWVALREPFEGLPCTDSIRQGCAALRGRVAIVSDAGTPAAKAVVKVDPNALHFMRRPTALAFGAADTFATCHEHRTGNSEDDPRDFIGPALWSSDPAIFTVPGDNGSHLDMVHATPYCMGIAHERDNVFWTFNGARGSIDRYDFHLPHEPGGPDHSDGEVHRYVEGQLSRVPEVPSHMEFDPSSGLLYVADTGHRRVVALDTTTGTKGDDLPVYEALAEARAMDGAVLSEVIAPGVLEAPSGLHLWRGILFVGDNATGRIVALDVTTGELVRTLDTGAAPGALGALTVGPDERMYAADLSTAFVYRIDPVLPPPG